MQFTHINGATSINPDEASELIPKSILIQSELNEWEQSNITEAEIWLFKKKVTVEELASIEFMRKCHYKMFSKTWRWAGKFRKTDKNIGVCWTQIGAQLKILCDDVVYQVQNNTYTIDEIAIRFHHRLVSIHCFPNGNGRHARIVTDYLLYILGYKKFNWGRENLCSAGETRNSYILALKKADAGEYLPLLSFARGI